MTRIVHALVLAATLATAQAAAAQAPASAPPAQAPAAAKSSMEQLRSAARTDKRGYVASQLALTEEEAKKFWPVYDAYQRALEQSNRRRSVALVEVASAGKPIGDLHARNVAKELIQSDEAELTARRTMRDRTLRALPPKKAIRYLQLEWQLRAAQNYDIAEAIPLLPQ